MLGIAWEEIYCRECCGNAKRSRDEIRGIKLRICENSGEYSDTTIIFASAVNNSDWFLLKSIQLLKSIRLLRRIFDTVFKCLYIIYIFPMYYSKVYNPKRLVSSPTEINLLCYTVLIFFIYRIQASLRNKNDFFTTHLLRNILHFY